MASSTSGVGPTARGREQYPYASGWTIFAGVMLITAGLMAIFQGSAAITHDSLLVVTRSYVYAMNTEGWGWIHLILGVFVVVAGVAVFSGAAWARIVGLVVAGLGMIANFLWLPYYPLWAIVLIAIDALVIWALCVGTIKTDPI
ncbi:MULTISPECIES: hypothetical protein [Streptomycetaceae]|uniref:DUF7144 family membrane protein n=1 Tax=Streptomycetaceae TaxID=2062 RepID=UPI0006707B78|nr:MULTISPECIES: hypothetical protein [Streptomycetaceae]OKH97941.1 hypothetical protein AMK13_36660 [Streptomyces sp. CB02056]